MDGTWGFVPGASIINTQNYNNLSFYVADQWRVRPSLTLNLGVRYELNNALQNQGLSVTPINFGLTAVIDNPPPVPTPPFVPPPLTFASINSLAPGANVGFLIDPNLQLPRVEQYNFGLQREIGFKSVLEIRYVGNRSHELIRTVDLNQVDIRSNGFLPDYIRAGAGKYCLVMRSTN